MFILILFTNCLPKNVKVKTWERRYLIEDIGQAYSIQQTNDGGYIVAGVKYYTGGTNGDVYIIKLDGDGNTEWNRIYGGKGWDRANSIQQTDDGGYIVAGETGSLGAGLWDVYILKLDVNGNKEWEKTYGGKQNDEAYSIQQTYDGGYIVAGYTKSFGEGEEDAYILKLDRNGNKEWEKLFGESGWNVARSIQQTFDGGYIVAGYIEGAYIIKLDRNGNKEWEKLYDYEYCPIMSVKQTKDGGYVATGWKGGFISTEYNGDVYVIKLDRNGNKEWDRNYDGLGDDGAYSIQQTNDGGYIVAGATRSYNEAPFNIYIIKLDRNGNKEWEKIYKNKGGEARSIQQTDDGGYIVAGSSSFYIIKLDSNGNIN